MRRVHVLCFALLLAMGCGNRVDKDQKPDFCLGVTECKTGDSCCPSGCTADTDDDCSAANSSNAVCGNGVVEAGETCDGDCPTSCTSTDPCAGAVLSGSPENCNVVCDVAPITTCVTGDRCCPELCTEDNDGDCVAGCGNGILEPGELCDGDCPTACGDDDACTRDVLTGSASTCSALCSYETIDVCQDGDSCCPTGCTEANDSDCACVPTTCAAEGAECGTIPDGCQGTLTCPNTCSANEVCSGTTCQAGGNGMVGSACASAAQCSGFANAYCETYADYKGGYCTAVCSFDNDCPMGSHCARLFAGDPAQKKICMKNCTSAADCRADGYACQNWDDFDQNAQVSDECGPAATGTGEIGDPCSGLSDCAEGTFCAMTETNGQGSVTFPGGACTATCVPLILGCGAGYVCGDMAFCMPECTSSLQCRAGYTCIASQFEARSHCWPQ